MRSERQELSGPEQICCVAFRFRSPAQELSASAAFANRISQLLDHGLKTYHRKRAATASNVLVYTQAVNSSGLRPCAKPWQMQLPYPARAGLKLPFPSRGTRKHSCSVPTAETVQSLHELHLGLRNVGAVLGMCTCVATCGRGARLK